VGIGTTSPLSRLDVNTSTSPLTISNGTTAIGEISYASSGSPNRVLTLAGLDGIRFFDFTTERMRIDSSGNVGIGTTTPGDKLEIGGAGAGIILASPDGTRYRVTVTDLGVLTVAAV
jgi:hypothetical protein